MLAKHCRGSRKTSTQRAVFESALLVLSGVPQGTALGPLLFLPHSNDVFVMESAMFSTGCYTHSVDLTRPTQPSDWFAF